MKTKLFLLSITAMIFVSSCTMDKRIYSSGWHVEWRSNKAHVPEESSIENNERTNETGKHIFTQEILTADNDTGQEIHFIQKPEIKNLSCDKNPPPIFTESLKTHESKEDTGSIIITKKGDTIHCKITRETSMRIYYMKNEIHDSMLNQSEQSVLRTDVTYYGLESNAKTPDQIKEDKNSENETRKLRKVNGDAVASFCLSILATLPVWLALLHIYGMLFLIMPLCGVLGIISGVTALVQMKRSPKKWKGQGFAIAGIVLGIIDMIFIVLAFIALSSLSFSFSI